METLVVELKNEKVRRLLEDMQDMKLLNIVKADKKTKSDFSKFIGILSKEEGEELLKFVNESRNEWERDI